MGGTLWAGSRRRRSGAQVTHVSRCPSFRLMVSPFSRLRSVLHIDGSDRRLCVLEPPPARTVRAPRRAAVPVRRCTPRAAAGAAYDTDRAAAHDIVDVSTGGRVERRDDGVMSGGVARCVSPGGGAGAGGGARSDPEAASREMQFISLGFRV